MSVGGKTVRRQSFTVSENAKVSSEQIGHTSHGTVSRPKRQPINGNISIVCIISKIDKHVLIGYHLVLSPAAGPDVGYVIR
jgi:hypothetical protein